MTDEKTTAKLDLAVVEEIVKNLFELMGSDAKFEITEDSENNAALVNIDSEKETGLLIGSRGDTLMSIQTVLGMIYRTKTGEWARILVNIADWREKQEDKLKHLADTTAQRVKETGESVPLYNLSPADRRIVHMFLADDSEVETESIGEGQDRHLVVHLKK